MTTETIAPKKATKRIKKHPIRICTRNLEALKNFGKGGDTMDQCLTRVLVAVGAIRGYEPEEPTKTYDDPVVAESEFVEENSMNSPDEEDYPE